MYLVIASRFLVGLNVGIVAALLVINRRLYKIASRTAAISTKGDRLRAIYVDLAIGLSIPFLQMVLGGSTLVSLRLCLIGFSEIIIEGHRFDIFEEIGCYPDIFNVTLAFPITYLWPVVLSLITTIYCGALGSLGLSLSVAHHALVLNVRLFWKSSQTFNGMLGSHKNPNHNRYIRLIALSATQISYILPTSLYSLYFNSNVLILYPWISWENTHSHYSKVDQIPSLVWRSTSAQAIMEIMRWNTVFSAFLFFAFFGFAEEARKHYRIAYSFASSSLRLPDLRKSGASSSPPYTPSSSFGGGFKKGVVSFFSSKDSLSTLESHTQFETVVAERKDSFLVSEYRLTSSASIFEGVDHTEKALELLPDEDDAPDSRSVPPPPIAVRVIPPNRLNSPLPHRPTSSDLYRDASKNV